MKDQPSPPDPHHITAENAYLYSPDARQSGESIGQRLKRFWNNRTRPQQVLLVSGTILILFSSLMIGLSLGHSSSTKTSQTTLAGSQQTSQGSGSSSDGSTAINSADDANGNGVPDNEEGVVEGGEGVAWWKKLFNVVRSSDDETADESGDEEEATQVDETYDESVEEDVADQNDADVEDDFVDQEEEEISYITDPVVTQKDTTLTLTIGSWNVYLRSSTDKVISGVKSLLGDVDILGIQEGASYASAFKDRVACSSCKYSMYPTANKTPRKIAIFWHKDKFKLISSGFRHGSTQDGVKKYFVWVKLKENTSGKVFYVINTHFPFDSTIGGSLRNTSGGKAYQKHMPTLVKLIKEFQKTNLPIFVTGDINADYRADKGKTSALPRAALSEGLNVKSGWEYLKLKGISSGTGTAGSSRIIDYVFSWKQSYITYQSMEIIRSGSSRNGWSGSDHKPIALTLTIGKQN